MSIFTKSRFDTYEKNAYKRGYSFNLSQEQFDRLISSKCRYCNSRERIGVDRVNNTQGYSVNNCVPCCFICNRAKGTLEVKDWFKYLKRIQSSIIDYNIKEDVVVAPQKVLFKQELIDILYNCFVRDIDNLKDHEYNQYLFKFSNWSGGVFDEERHKSMDFHFSEYLSYALTDLFDDIDENKPSLNYNKIIEDSDDFFLFSYSLTFDDPPWSLQELRKYRTGLTQFLDDNTEFCKKHYQTNELSFEDWKKHIVNDFCYLRGKTVRNDRKKWLVNGPIFKIINLVKRCKTSMELPHECVPFENFDDCVILQNNRPDIMQYIEFQKKTTFKRSKENVFIVIRIKPEYIKKYKNN